MVAAGGWVFFMGSLMGAPQDDPRVQEPPPPIVEVPPVRVEDPRPEFPVGDRFTLRTIAMRPRWDLTTREFDAGMFSGQMNLGDVAEFERTSMALEGRLDLGPWMISAMILNQKSRFVLNGDTTFEQHEFPAGTVVEGTAFFSTLEVFYRFDVAGGPADPFQVSMLVGINWSKLYMGLSDDVRNAREGFSALWPLPALGVEARYWMTDRLSVTASARGTRFRFENPFQLDGGETQDIRYLFGRFDASLEWALSSHFSVAAGYTGIDAFINAASPEDTDTADLKSGGLHAGMSLNF